MKWNKTDLEQFFGSPPSLGMNQEALYIFDYASKRLRYMLAVDEKEHQVSISADPETPFGADSLYEVYVPCDTIQLFSDPYHAEFKAVGFWYGRSNERSNLRLTIMKVPTVTSKFGRSSRFRNRPRCGEPNPALHRVAARRRRLAIRASAAGRHR